MNLGDGLKLETQILDGKPRLILASCAVESKVNKQAGYKTRIQKHSLKTKQTGQIVKSSQSTNVKTEKSLPKNRTGPGLSTSKGDKKPGNLLPRKPNCDLPKESKDHASIPQENIDIGKQHAQKTDISIKKTVVSNTKQKPQTKPNITAEELRNSLVCLTQEQLQQILLAANRGSKAVCEDQDDSERDRKSLDASAINNETQENSGLHQMSDVSPVQVEKDVLTEKVISMQEGQKLEIGSNDRWQQGDIFSTLGERERDKDLLEAKKSQWKKELDEQVALKKKQKESFREQVNYLSGRHSADNANLEKPTIDQLKVLLPADSSVSSVEDRKVMGKEISDAVPVSYGSSSKNCNFTSPNLPAAIRTAFVLGEAAPLEHPFSATKREQQKKWVEELNKQREEVALRKMQEKQKYSEIEEHDRWAMHFDSFKRSEKTQLPLNISPMQQADTAYTSPEPQDALDRASTLSTLSYPGPEKLGRTNEDISLRQSQKTSFLRSMTALLDPIQIEERERRRQKQLEHQKAIAAQVEEKRRQKQLEEERKQKEEQEEERRMILEREQMQKQFEEEMLKQKQKEEVQTLKKQEIYQSIERAQEQAQRLKREQRMQALAKKGHDISKLQRNIDGDTTQWNYNRAPSSLSDLNPDDGHSEICDKTNQVVKALIAPRKETAVQTDDYGIKKTTSSEAYIGPCVEGENIDRSSPDVSIEFKDQLNNKKHRKEIKLLATEYISTNGNKESFSDPYHQFSKTESQVKNEEKPGKRPDWNTNRPSKKYIPASNKYPKELQRQRQESQARRQMELLQLVERNTSRNRQRKKDLSPQRSPTYHGDTKERHKLPKDEENSQKYDYNKRSESPLVPAVKNRMHHMQQRQMNISDLPSCNGNSNREKNIYLDKQQSELSPENSELETERPPSSQFVPYVRTKEIYYLDPDAPMSRPSTHDPQHRHLNGADHEAIPVFNSDHMRDPLLNPNMVKNKYRQQAILKGLSELRQGLLQKQKELETGLIPDVEKQEEILFHHLNR
ncbi:coiled-coil domain-containing protein 66 isoform X2 [Microcaecilia unicolor]|uniref:Coiled-coil domain-containing protein 66 isoform X2 n=1 Tax=Microcaecilia unicolor TaxID=1415580 RepID=A0A6P7YAH8_9AMPH|nr:coiled-coil domain-containing protein 66 isoform X2 [Microcaecilia unicolor]